MRLHINLYKTSNGSNPTQEFFEIDKKNNNLQTSLLISNVFVIQPSDMHDVC